MTTKRRRTTTAQIRRERKIRMVLARMVNAEPEVFMVPTLNGALVSLVTVN